MLVYRNPLLQPLHGSSLAHRTKFVESRLSDAWWRPEASWRGMLLSQPAVQARLISPFGNNDLTVTRAQEALDLAKELKQQSILPISLRINGIEKWRTLTSSEELEELPMRDIEE